MAAKKLSEREPSVSKRPAKKSTKRASTSHKAKGARESKKGTDDPIIGFGVVEQVSGFFLREAFKYVHKAAAYEVADIMFGKRIMSIDPEPGFELPFIPQTLNEYVDNKETETSEAFETTIGNLAEAWYTSLAEAPASGLKIKRTQRLRSITDVVGHAINMAACVECALNGHLYFLRETGKLEDQHYLALDRTEALPKLLFAFKEEIAARKLETSRLRYLFSLRNKAVHFRPATADSIVPMAEDLMSIWREVGRLFGLMRGEPTQKQVNEYASEFQEHWIK